MISLYILGALLIVLLLGVILAPLLEREPPDRDLEDLPPDERHEAALEALREVEFDYRTDKLPEEEYRRLRTHYGRLALEAEEEMEAEPERDRAATPRASAERSGERGGTAAGGAGAGGASCAGCGAAVPAGARYCPRCGEEQPGT